MRCFRRNVEVAGAFDVHVGAAVATPELRAACPGCCTHAAERCATRPRSVASVRHVDRALRGSRRRDGGSSARTHFLARQEFAERYLARGTLTASEVAYLIGFTEPPAFFKAFKCWTGLTPREFQERGRAPAV